ncbi:hypothetical protein M2232_002321 [Bradyrhizobium japonicum]|uniref:hypothetical protein n=1 Tax=Bradyrhizobium japonicum TaxID=375 RepID=UPI0022265267|nr:hypothetical protein [Bradyrhizobium japonicum]MCW2218789.1 hypothetical protein [Bradyrhizobium japonicum]MCW2343403.1 hypothetical protein [Bradyrhizobium japonicum]
MDTPLDDAGPTPERLRKAAQFFTVAGRSRSSRKITMLDDALGKAWMRQTISAQEYSALRRYALHWVAGGLQGSLGSVDLNRIYAFDPSSMTGLARSEAQLDHKRTYYAAKQAIGFRPSFVADQIACFGRGLQETGASLGMRSPYRAREKAAELLGDAGHRLGVFFDALR